MSGYGVVALSGGGTGLYAKGGQRAALLVGDVQMTANLTLGAAASQARSAGGLVKALAHIKFPKKGLPSIDRWFNSQGKSGFRVYLVSEPGVIAIDFGFPVNDRFVNATVDFRTSYWAPNDPNNLAAGWIPIPLDANGNDLSAETLTPTPRVGIAMISIIGTTLVQAECFTMQMQSMGGGAFATSYTRANHDIMITIY
jgi:hypothetical protein